MTDRLAYQVVDVFTDRAFAGNPLAVVLDGGELTTEQMQAIAREFNLSETTFPMAAESAEASYRLRIFTPSTELPFAGHPSIGSAWLMRELGRVSGGRVVQECGAGLLPLTLDGDRVTLTGGTPSIGPVLDEAAALRAVGLDASDFAGDSLRWAGAGLEFGYLHVKPDAVARCVPDAAAIGRLHEMAQLSVFSYADGRAHARVFAAGAGVAEDPATGSAALGLGVWLVASGLVAADGETPYLIEQGLEMGRPSRLECVVAARAGEAVSARVTGQVVAVAEGTIRVP